MDPKFAAETAPVSSSLQICVILAVTNQIVEDATRWTGAWIRKTASEIAEEQSLAPKWKNQGAWRQSASEIAEEQSLAPKWKNQGAWRQSASEIAEEQSLAPKWNQRAWKQSASGIVGEYAA
jgi:hypothetical protein